MNLKEISVEAEVQAQLQQYRVKWGSFWLSAMRMVEKGFLYE